jgi:hypothetical protein
MEKIWARFYTRGVPKEIGFDEITLADALKLTASIFPEKHALIFQGTAVTFKELEEMVGQFAWAPRGFGVRTGSRVAFLISAFV